MRTLAEFRALAEHDGLVSVPDIGFHAVVFAFDTLRPAPCAKHDRSAVRLIVHDIAKNPRTGLSGKGLNRHAAVLYAVTFALKLDSSACRTYVMGAHHRNSVEYVLHCVAIAHQFATVPFAFLLLGIHLRRLMPESAGRRRRTIAVVDPSATLQMDEFRLLLSGIAVRLPASLRIHHSGSGEWTRSGVAVLLRLDKQKISCAAFYDVVFNGAHPYAAEAAIRPNRMVEDSAVGRFADLFAVFVARPAVLDGKPVVLVRLFRRNAPELLTSDAYLAVDNGKYTLRVAVPASALDELVPVRQILPVE